MPRLSQELIDIIVNEIDLDDPRAQKTLYACCTVCSTFLPASRARLWRRFELPPDPESDIAQTLVATLDSKPQLALLVRTFTFTCNENLSVQAIQPFQNVEHLRILGELRSLEEDTEDYITTNWGPELKELSFVGVTLPGQEQPWFIECFLPLYSKVKSLRLEDCDGEYIGLEGIQNVARSDGELPAPDSLFLDCGPVGAGVAQAVLDRPCGFSLQAIKHLELGAPQDLEKYGDWQASQNEEEHVMIIMRNLIAAIPHPLEELGFHHCDGLFSHEDGATLETLTIANIPRISFDVFESDEHSADTLRWWTRNIQTAKKSDGWAVEDFQISIIRSTDRQRSFANTDGSGVPGEVWDTLDQVLSISGLDRLTIWIQSGYQRLEEDEDSVLVWENVAETYKDATEFQQSIRGLLHRCVQLPGFILRDTS